MSFIQLSPEKWNFNVFNAIKNWMVLTAGTPSNCNSMIVSWGALGIMWNKPTASVYVRESRYTLPFMQEEDYFTLYKMINEDSINLRYEIFRKPFRKK